MWDPLTQVLDGSVDALVIDLPGHGTRSEETYRSHEATAREIATSIAATHPGGVHVVGFSLGAQLAILLASTYPHLVRSAVIVSGETIPAPMPRTTLRLLQLTLPLAKRPWFARAQARELGVPAALLDHYVHDSRHLSAATVLNSVGENIRFVLPPSWGTYPGPVHVLVGAHERQLMQRSAQLTHERARHSTLTIVPGSAHDLPLTNPGLLAEVIRQITHTPQV